jgi:hypothetical protein
MPIDAVPYKYVGLTNEATGQSIYVNVVMVVSMDRTRRRGRDVTRIRMLNFRTIYVLEDMREIMTRSAVSQR